MVIIKVLIDEKKANIKNVKDIAKLINGLNDNANEECEDEKQEKDSCTGIEEIKSSCSSDLRKEIEKLESENALEMKSRLMEAKMIDENWNCSLSRTLSAMLANFIADNLDITNKWKVFEYLWNRNGLRADYNRALEQRQSLKFQDELKGFCFENQRNRERA